MTSNPEETTRTSSRLRHIIGGILRLLKPGSGKPGGRAAVMGVLTLGLIGVGAGLPASRAAAERLLGRSADHRLDHVVVADTSWILARDSMPVGTGGSQIYNRLIQNVTITPGHRYIILLENGSNGSYLTDSVRVRINGSTMVPDGIYVWGQQSDITDILAMLPTDSLRVTVYGPDSSYVITSIFSEPDPAFTFMGPDSLRDTIAGGTTTVHQDTIVRPTNGDVPYRMYVVNGNGTGENRLSSVDIKINGTGVISNASFNSVGSITRTVTLNAGNNPLRVEVNGAAGAFLTLRLVATDTMRPVLTVSAPGQNSVTNGTTTSATGTISDQTITTVTVNGVAAQVINNASYSLSNIALAEGANLLTIQAKDAAGLTRDSSRNVTRDTQAPSLTVVAPAESTYTKNDSITVSGTVSDATTSVTVNTNGTPLTMTGGNYSGSVSLVYGANLLTTTATDQANNTTSIVRNVFRDTLAPTLAVSAPIEGFVTELDSVTVTGTVSDASALTLVINGASVTPSGGAFTKKVGLALGANAITVQATDAASNVTTIVRNGTRTSPNPSLVASPINPTTATTIGASTQFLYTGTNPVQTGVDTGTIEMHRAAVIRGKVLAASGAPLPGVTVTVLSHLEYGQTVSRDSGGYDLAVNGGSRLTLNYAKTGYLTAQRQLPVAWQEFSSVDSVVLIPVDTVVTTIGFAQPIEVARSSSVSDSDGTRRGVMMFEQGTTATMVMPNGSTQSLSSVKVRATEFTVGTMGEARMPADLPPQSAYTYAVELSVDSAITAGAASVQFSKPVAYYVENFLGFDVGTHVPVGYYDRTKGAWVPQPDGRVIKIDTIVGGRADLVVDTTGVTADSAALAALGITNAERDSLGGLYSIGTTLWRTEHTHFSPYDMNWAERIIAPFIWPNGGAPTTNPHEPCQGNEPGSVIGCEGQTLGEVLPVTGTPFRLHYQSERTPGYEADYRIDIPLRGDTIPPTVTGMAVTIDIAGKQYAFNYPRSQMRAVFTWDGKDAYGRFVQGRQPYRIRIGFTYPMFYGIAGGSSAGGFGSSGGQITVITGRREIQLQYEYRGFVGPWNSISLALGGWTMDAHHAYDPTDRTLHYGFGSRRQVQALGNVLSVAAGTGTAGFLGDSGQATLARINSAQEIAVGPDGSLYISDLTNHRIRRVGTDGVISTIAGTGTGGSNSDTIATSAHLNAPQGIAVGPDGSVYFADRANHRVRKIDTLGIIRTVAGTGAAGFSGNGGRADTAKLSFPYDVAVGPDGSIYIVDQGNHRVRRVDPSGIISTFAGNGVNGYSGDGLPADSAQIGNPRSLAVDPQGVVFVSSESFRIVRRIGTDGVISTVAGIVGGGLTQDGKPATSVDLGHPKGIAIGPDGALYIAESAIISSRGYRISRVGQDGIITTIAGNGIQACNSPNGTCHVGDQGNGGLATQAYLYGSYDVAFAPDGTMYFTDPGNHQVRKIAPAQPGLSPNDLLIAAEDGSVVYQFEATGRHKKTLDAITGAALLSFGYDSLSRLVTLTDTDSNVTTIQRATNGRATGILAPFGQRTVLTVDTALMLRTLANPGGEAYQFRYTAKGLLDSLVDPRGKGYRFTYDSVGYLTRDDDPAGGYKTLIRSVLPATKNGADSVYSVTVTTALGRVKKYQVERLGTGATRRILTSTANLKTISILGTNNTDSAFTPDSMIVAVVRQGDPRWGLQAPILSTLTVKLPSGLTSTVTAVRRDSLSSPSNPLSLVSQIDSVRFNGNLSINTYTAATRRLVQTSAEGRQIFSKVDSLGRVISAQVAGVDSVRFTYDSRGRLTSKIDGGRSTTYGYSASSGRLASITDPLSRVTQFNYDSAGRIKSQTMSDGRLVQFAYDSSGNVVSLTPSSRPAHGFLYTGVDLASQYNPPLLGGAAKPSVYSYNLDHQITRIARPDSINVDITYDAAGRPDSIKFDRGFLRFGYSSVSGTLTSILAPGGDSLKFTYDGALPDSVAWKGTVVGNVAATYGGTFRVTSQRVNGANAVDFSYDRDGLLVQAGGLGLRRNTTNGLLLADSLGPVKSTLGYSSRGELTNHRVTRSASTLFAAGYTVDSLGRISQLADTTNGSAVLWGFTYDSVGRLKTTFQNGNPHHAFTYDSNSNRLSYVSGAGTTTYRYDSQDRLLATYFGTDSTVYEFGSNGELRRKAAGTSDTTHLSYDALGNLTRVILPVGDTLDYVIDGLNRRVGRKVNGNLVRSWLYQNKLNVVAELDSIGSLVSRFVYGTGTSPDYMIKNGNVYRLVTDHLGSIRLVVDTATGSIVQQIDYDEQGNITANTNPDFQPFGFAGGLYDEATKLVRFGARDYDPAIGRWLSKDPLGFGGRNANLYAYSGNDPVNNIDPSGLEYFDRCVVAALLREMMRTMRDNPGSFYPAWPGGFDFKVKDPGFDPKHPDNFVPEDFYEVDGRWIRSDEFGNFAAGYVGEARFGLLGLAGVHIGGMNYARGGEGGFDRDSWPMIELGASYADRDWPNTYPNRAFGMPRPYHRPLTQP